MNFEESGCNERRTSFAREVHCELMNAFCDRDVCNRQLCLIAGQSLQSDLFLPVVGNCGFGRTDTGFLSLYEMQFNRGWTCTCLCKCAVKNNYLRLHSHPWKYRNSHSNQGKTYFVVPLTVIANSCTYLDIHLECNKLCPAHDSLMPY